MKTAPDNVDSLVLRAALAAHNNDIPSAQRDVGAALQKQPQNVDAAILTATLDMRTGHADEAVERLNKTIAQHPKNTGLHAVLAAIYAQQGKIDEGAAHIKSIIALEPQVASHRVRLAEYYVVNKRPKEAEQVLSEGLQQPALKKEMQLALVNMQVAQGKPDQAMRSLTQFIKESPEDYALRFRMAELHLAANKPEVARVVYQDIITAAGTKPEGQRARTQLARLLIAQGQPAPAGALLAQVLKENPRDNAALIAPNDGDTRVLLASLLAEQGKQANAREQLERVLKQDPKHLAALETLFRMQMAQSEYVQAAQLAQRIQAQQPARGEYYQGVVLQAQKKHGEAITHFEAALTHAPGASEPLTALVKSRLALNQAGLAEQRLTQELAREKGNVIAQNLLGEVLLIEKKTDEAIAALRAAERLDPKLASPYHSLATAYLAKGDSEAAVAARSAAMAS